MARYAIEVKPAFEKDFDALPKDVQRRVATKIDALAANPRPHGVEKLAGADELYRIRIGEYRVVYQIRDKVLIVLLVRVRHRREVYR